VPRAALAAAAANRDCCGTSSLYRTAPVGIRASRISSTPSPQLETDLDAAALLDALFADRSLASVAAASSTMRRAPSISTCCSTIDAVIDSAATDACRTRACTCAPSSWPRSPKSRPLCRIPGRGSVAAWLPAVRMQRIERMGAMETHGR
jgi:2-amino-4-hydroxy-6-hydroxymethyldihydropteridine diphosphokinase